MKKYLWIVALLAALAMVTVGCTGSGPGSGPGGEGEGEGVKGNDITYTAVATGTPTSTAITLTFADDVTITADVITITAGTGAATKGALTGSAKAWSLAISAVTAGTVKVKITQEGIEAAEKTVTVIAPISLYLPEYQAGTGDAAGAESQAVWVFNEDDKEWEFLAIPGTILEVTFKNELAGTLQLIWQPGWNQADITTTTGAGKEELGTTVSEDKKTITIDLALAIKSYGNFLDALESGDEGIKLILAYYSGPNKMKGLEVVSAILIPPELGIYVPVTDITYTGATAAQTGVELTLVADVMPWTATNRTIVWTVPAADGTISGNKFTASKAGTATVTATIVNGKSETEDFTITVDITVTDPVDAPDYTPDFSTLAIAYASWAASHTKPTLTAITDGGTQTGYTWDFTGIPESHADYDNVYPYFKLTFADDVSLRDYGTVTFTYTGISGDLGSKQIGLYARDSAFPTNGGGLDTTNWLVSTSTAGINGEGDETITLTIDKSKAASISTGNVFYVSIFTNMAKTGGGSSTKYSINNVTFKK